MTEKLAVSAKQVGSELINMSDQLAMNMQTWDDLLKEVPDSVTAKLSAGFITKPSANSRFEMTIDVQAPPGESAVLRTWAIETIPTDNEEAEYYNNIQLTFNTDAEQVGSLLAKGDEVTRDDIRHLLQDPVTKLARIIVSNESGGDGTQQTHGQRYDFTADELMQHLDKVDEIEDALKAVLQKLKSHST